MTEPERMLKGSGDDVEVALLRSAMPDRPSRRAMQSTLLALGVGSGVTAATSAASASTAVATAAAAKSSSATAVATAAAAKTAASIPPAAALASEAGIAVLVKWVGIAGIAAVATWGAVSQLATNGPGPETTEITTLAVPPRAAPSEVAPTPPVTNVAEGTATTAAADDTERPSEVSPPVARETATAPRPAPRPLASAPVSPEAPTSQPTSLGDEVAALDQARKQMQDDPEAALAALEDYDEGFKGGVLAQEAELLRIEALSRAGKKDQARAAATTFLARHPESPLAGRVRKILQ